MWYVFIDLNREVKPHLCSVELTEQLKLYLKNKYGAEPDPQFCDEREHGFLDTSLRSAYALNQPRMTFEVPNGAKLELDCHGLAATLEKLERVSKKHFDDGTLYYKVYTQRQCMVLTPAARESLIFQLRGSVQEAERLANEFYGVARD